MTPGFPLIGLGTAGEGGIDLSSFLPPNSSWQGTPTPNNLGPISGKAGDVIGKVGGALGKAYDAVAKNSFLGMLFGSDYQYLTGIIGLILIAAGIFLFRPVRETVISAGKTAAKGAALAA